MPSFSALMAPTIAGQLLSPAPMGEGSRYWKGMCQKSPSKTLVLGAETTETFSLKTNQLKTTPGSLPHWQDLDAGKAQLESQMMDF